MESPRSRAHGVGDPHFVTLDGLGFSFNGWGEYHYLSLLDSADSTRATAPFSDSLPFVFRSQIRTMPVANASASSGPTVRVSASTPQLLDSPCGSAFVQVFTAIGVAGIYDGVNFSLQVTATRRGQVSLRVFAFFLVPLGPWALDNR